MPTEDAVAVVGMACRLPGADDVPAYWAALTGGVDGITRFDPEWLLAEGADPAYVRRENFVPAMGVITGSRRFDRAFFRYSRAEAAAMDPQQRVFLECASTAVDDAAIDPSRFPGRIGVYAGADRVGHHADEEQGELARYIGQEKDFLATRVAYRLGLRGPALTVQTACSTSLTAVHLAARALVGGECDAALAGGVTVMPEGEWGYLFEQGGILSPDGRCRPFDARAAGTVPSEGVAVVVLRRLADALRDGDRIAAVITGTAVNNDGSDKMAYTAPSAAGQSEVIRAAQRIAGVDPADIDYVEAHGTATRLGDPVEVQALAEAFGTVGRDGGPCLLGAVKGNIGHTGVVSGVAGLIKTVLMLERGQLVPTAHFTSPNPLLELEDSPFRIADANAPWPERGTRLAAVSSFGVGGTNAHVVLQGAPSHVPRTVRGGPRPLALSAATPEALGRLAGALADRLDPDGGGAEQPPTLAGTARTLAARRVHRHRRMLVASDPAQAARLLRGVQEGADTAPDTGGGAGSGGRTAAAPPRKLGKAAFLFPGQGTLRHGAGAAAYRLLPGFRAAFDEIARTVRDTHGIDLAPVVTDAGTGTGTGTDQAPDASGTGAGTGAGDWFADTVHQQLGLFALGYAFGRQLEAWNVRPAAMLGNSVGEYAAAALAGVWSPADAAELVFRRARAMWDTEPGRMVSVRASAAEVLSRLPAGCEATVAVDGPGSVVLSGPEKAMDDLLAGDPFAGLRTTPVHTRRAFHTKAMEQAAEAVRATLSSVPARPPRRPLISDTTGTWADPQEVAGPDYWAAQLRRPVLLGAAMETLLGSGCTTYVELGPGSSMIAGLRSSPGWNSAHQTVRLTSGPDETGDAALLAALAALWELGADRVLADVPDVLDVLDAADPRHGEERVPRCSLPAHPFLGEDLRRRGRGRRTDATGPAAPAERAVAPAPDPVTAPAAAARPAPAAAVPPAPAATVRPVLAELWCRTLGVDGVRDDDDFFALGGESLLAVTLTARIRERTGCALSVTDFSRAPSFGDLVGEVERHLPAPSATPPAGAVSASRGVPGVAVLGDGGTGRPVFLAADATGTALPYRTLAGLLENAGGRPVLGLEDTGGPRPRTVEAVAAGHVRALLRAQPEGPYTIGGWSYGAVVAHEMARQLARRGERVDLLVCLDGFVPDTGGLPAAFAPDFLGAGLRAQAGMVLGTGPAARRLRRSPELRRRFVAGQAAVLRYRPRPVPCPAVLLKASSGQAEADRLRDRLAGLYRGGITVEPVDGDHWSMLARPYAPELALKLLKVLPADTAAERGKV
ncbi:type I polyketide synthase [Streptomyces nitrosporeus]|uniref:type I polyketide synthase n=1 Tax=Streptomyces nitrosporeus TaxID=28894 RepID=UPI0033242876